MDRGSGEIPCEYVGGQYIEAGEPTVKESGDRSRLLGPSNMVSGTRDNPPPEATLLSVYM